MESILQNFVRPNLSWCKNVKYFCARTYGSFALKMRVTASRVLDNGVQKRAKLSSGSDLRRSNLSESKSDAIFAEMVLTNPLDCNKI